ncbi:MAG: metallophosphoesterase [Verrucomicrobiales bacterium]|nr:metallophosphoesterase [Verrucomicrobiales bacterium]
MRAAHYGVAVLRIVTWLLLIALPIVQARASRVQLVVPGDLWRFQPLADAPPPSGWMEPGFEDSGWLEGPAGFSLGYFGYQQAATLVPDYLGASLVRGAVLRREFVVEDAGSLARLFLRAEYDDGIRIWLNGLEIVRRGYPEGGDLPWNAPGTLHALGPSELIDLSAQIPLLKDGTNLLAVQVMDLNVPPGSLFFWCELRANFSRGPIVQGVQARQAVVTWEGPTSVSGWVEIQSPDGALRRVESGSKGPSHGVVLSDLDPGTSYTYRVGWSDGRQEVTTPPATFRTLRTSGDVDFIVFGDTGSGLPGQYHVASALQQETPDLVLHTGDIVYPGFFAWRMDLRCLGVYESSMARTPFFFTPGNHDVYGSIPDYLEAFWMPTNDVTGADHFYSFDHGDVHFTSLFVPWYGFSSLGLLGPQTGGPSAQYLWLQRDLAQSKKPWKVVFFHQAPRSSGPHVYDDYNVDGRPDQGELLEALLPVLEQNGVRVVFTGHDHFWERFAPTNGVHFVVTGGGGGVPYGVFRRDPGSAHVISQHHFVRVSVRGDEMHLESVSTNGTRLDEFIIRTAAPAATRLESSWHHPELPFPEAPRQDGNVPGERFDFVGTGLSSVSGRSVNLGRLMVNDDVSSVHVGLRDVMVWPGQTLALFIGSPRLDGGVSNLVGMGRDRAHPLGGLPLRFEGFRPQWVMLLGDEWVDGTDTQFVRSPAVLGLGQGAFRLDEAMTPWPSIGIRQFDRSPQIEADLQEQSADFMIVSIPRTALGGVRPGDVLDLAAVAVTPVSGSNGPQLTLDTAYLGAALRIEPGTGDAAISAVRVVLSRPPSGDLDLDGLDADEEEAAMTDPLNPDSDGDGLPDGWEVRFHLSPVSGAGADGKDGDPDGDDYSNEEEFRSGTSPADAASTLRMSAFWQSGALTLTWRSMIGRRYDVEVAEDLGVGFRSLGLPDFPRVARQTNESMVFQSGPGGPGRRWFRLRELR